MVATVMSGTFDGHDVRRVAVAAELAGVLTGMHTTAFDDDEPLGVVSLLRALAAKAS